MTQSLALGLQVLPELGQVLVHGLQHGGKGLFLHVGIFQGSVQGGGVAPELAIADGLQLDGIQGEGRRVPDGRVCRQLCLVGVLPHLGILIVSQVPHRRQVDGLVPVLDRQGAGDVGVKVCPGTAAGELHPGHNLLTHAGEQVTAGLFHVLKIVAIVPEVLISRHQLLKVLKAAGPLGEGSQRGGGVGVQSHNPAHLGTGLLVPGVGGLAQAGILNELFHQPGQLLCQGNAPGEPRQRLHALQTIGKGFQLLHQSLQGLIVPGKGRVREALVNRLQIPYFIHGTFLQKSFLHCITSVRLRQLERHFYPQGDCCRFVWNFIIFRNFLCIFVERLFRFVLAKYALLC